jgi:hypothetical protein
MEHSLSWEANITSGASVIPNTTIGYRVHKRPHLDLILSQINPKLNFLSSILSRNYCTSVIKLCMYVCGTGHIWPLHRDHH